MNLQEATLVLAKIAAFDNRKPSKAAANGWAEALDARMPVQFALNFVSQHYANSRDWLMPADINRAWGEQRKARIAQVSAADYPPGPDEPQKFLAFRRAFVDAIGDGADLDTAEGYAWRQIGMTKPELLPASHDPVLDLETTLKGIPA